MDKDLETGLRARECRWENDRWPDGNAGRRRQQARRQIEGDGGDAQDNRGSRVDRSALRQRDGGSRRRRSCTTYLTAMRTRKLVGNRRGRCRWTACGPQHRAPGVNVSSMGTRVEEYCQEHREGAMARTDVVAIGGSGGGREA
jgi:hypothetical protein